MSEFKEYKGYWWLPSAPEVQWFGTLNWEATESPKLTLDYKSEHGTIAPPEEAESFFGLNEHGTRLTILRAGCGSTHSAGFLSCRHYHAGHILEGIHAESLQSFRPNKVNFCLQYLGAWIGEEGFENVHHGIDGLGITYKRPETRSYKISPKVTLKLWHGGSMSAKARERAIRYDIYVTVERARSVDFNHAFRWMNCFRSFLHLACLRPVQLTAIKFECDDYRDKTGDKWCTKTIKLYGGSIHKSLEKDPNPPDFVFTFHDVKEKLEAILVRWFRFYVEQRESLDCYMASVYLNVLPSEIRIICLTQALEAFHEQHYRPTSKTDGEFINRIKLLCSVQAQRMKAIVGDLNLFAEQVRDTRNYYTHHNPDIRRKGKVMTGMNLMWMNCHLEYLFRLSVLAEFGLDADPYSMLKRQLPERVTEFF